MGAGDAFDARPRSYTPQGFDFLHIAEEEVGKPNRWRYKSDTAACILSLAQSHHTDCAKPDNNAPIVLISCSAYLGRGNGSYQEVDLRKVSIHPERKQNLKALQQKWSAVVKGREQHFPILALVLFDDDAELLATSLKRKPIPLTESVFRDLQSGRVESPALVAVKANHMPLLAHALDVNAMDFRPKRLTRRWLQLLSIIFILAMLTATAAIQHWKSNKNHQGAKKAITAIKQLNSDISTTKPTINISTAISLEKPLGECKVNSIKDKLFEKRWQPNLNVLILRFSEIGSSAKDSGHLVGTGIWKSLIEDRDKESATQEWKFANLARESFQIKYVPCYVASHEEARRIGKEWGASLVLWGSVRAASNKRQYITPYITSVSWISLAMGSLKNTHVSDSDKLPQITFPQLSNKEQVALIKYMIGTYAAFNQRHKLAIRYFEEVENIIKLEGDNGWEARLFVGNSYLKAGHIGKALKILAQTERFCQTDDCKGLSLLSHSDISFEQFHLDEVINYSREALKYLGSESEFAIPLYNHLGNAYEFKGQKRLAQHFYTKAINLATDKHNAPGAIMGSVYVAILRAKEEGKEELATELESLLKWSEQEDYPEAQALILSYLGKIYYTLKKYESAQAYYKRALAMSSSIGNALEQAHALYFIGKIHLDKEEYQEGFNSCHSSLEVLEKLDKDLIANIKQRTKTLECLAISCKSLSRTHDAIKFNKMNLEILEGREDMDNDDKLTLIGSLNRLAISYASLGQQRAALPLRARALALLGEIKEPGIPLIYMSLSDEKSDLELSLGLWQQAIQTYLQVGGYLKAFDPARLASYFEQAFDLSIDKGLFTESHMIIDAVRSTGDDLRAIAMEARKKARRGRYLESQETYLRLKQLAVQRKGQKTALGEDAGIWTYPADAALERIRAGGKLDGCLGVVVINRPQECQGRHDCLLLGDILLRQGNACINTYENVRQLPQKTNIKVKLWREGHLRDFTMSSQSRPFSVLAF